MVVVYRNDFEGPVGSRYAEWSSSPIRFVGAATGRAGELPAPAVATVESANGRARFLGEFGGPAIGRTGDADWNRTRVEQTVRLMLAGLGEHSRVRVSFDLYVLKSWDGQSARYGPDRFRLAVGGGGPVLMDETFSNNPKVAEDGSWQSYPGGGGGGGGGGRHEPWTGAAAVGSLGYGGFFKDGVYRLTFTFAHRGQRLELEFASSLFEGKGVGDESWGLDNVVVEADVGRP
jgi:hypothetical protein